MALPIITLTTDFGEKDPYVGAVKGAIYSALQGVPIVDISHGISPFHITEAAYVIENAYASFPKGTIHIIGVDGELTPENRHIAVALDGHYFVCANNGIMSLLSNTIKPEQIVEINIHDRMEGNFPMLDVFVAVACHIARGGKLEVIGKVIPKFKTLVGVKPVVNSDNTQIIGTVIYIDNYGNVVINIQKNLFDKVGKGRAFKISARTVVIRDIHTRYSEAINFDIPADRREEAGKKLAIWNSSDYLELALYKSNPTSVGSAATLFGLEYRDTVTVNFE